MTTIIKASFFFLWAEGQGLPKKKNSFNKSTKIKSKPKKTENVVRNFGGKKRYNQYHKKKNIFLRNDLQKKKTHRSNNSLLHKWCFFLSHGYSALSWNTDLKLSAFKRANTCVFQHSDSFDLTPPRAENMAKEFDFVEDAVEAFYINKQYYTPGTSISVWNTHQKKRGQEGNYSFFFLNSNLRLGLFYASSGKQKICKKK